MQGMQKRAQPMERKCVKFLSLIFKLGSADLQMGDNAPPPPHPTPLTHSLMSPQSFILAAPGSIVFHKFFSTFFAKNHFFV
jgi:hypothetical protein